jgi:polysaccharide export outer membrane protein
MKLFFKGLFACVLLFAGVFFTGCASSPDAPFFSDQSQTPSPTTNSPTNSATFVNVPNSVVPRFSVGDTVTVTLSGTGSDNENFQPYTELIKEDGTITLSLIGPIQAAGQTAGELQKTIHDLYVPKYYLRLTVTVKSSDDRIYYVSGEVHSPGRVAYVGDTTVTKAISAAGGLTDFASHSKVWLIRSSGQRIKVNYDKALEDQSQDPVVYPDDQINVERRIW